MRFDVLLARNTGWSRTAARAAIASGRVRIAGAAVDNPRLDVPAGDLPLAVEVDELGHLLYESARILQNKPVGCVTALRDDRHPTAYDLLREAPLWGELRAAGRLDLDSSGLLIWTTDGAEIQRLTHPKRAVPRTYQAALARPFNPLPSDLVLEDGHQPQVTGLETLAAADAHPSLQIASETTTLATITVVGGAYHEVRRIFAALGSHVLGLCRVRFGDFELPRDLPPGAYRLLPDGRPGAADGDRA
jgi:16S rRNA pseudouridine516 synthase